MVEIVGERSYPGVDNKIGMTFFDIRKKKIDLKMDKNYQ